MRSLPYASIERLVEIRDRKPAASPVGLASVIRSGLARTQLTPAGLFASRTGFVPSELDLTLLKALERGCVLSGREWQSDLQGNLRWAPDAYLRRFEQHGLAVHTRIQDNYYDFQATDACRDLAVEMNTRFGEGWARDPSLCGRRIHQLPTAPPDPGAQPKDRSPMPRIVFGRVLTQPDAFYSANDRRTVVVALESYSAAKGRHRDILGELTKVGRSSAIWAPCKDLRARIPKDAKDVYRSDLRAAKARIREVLQNG